MKYQYAIGKEDGIMEEIWVCSDCRKSNSGFILTGEWRLINRSDNQNLQCDCCGAKKQTLTRHALFNSACAFLGIERKLFTN